MLDAFLHRTRRGGCRYGHRHDTSIFSGLDMDASLGALAERHQVRRSTRRIGISAWITRSHSVTSQPNTISGRIQEDEEHFSFGILNSRSFVDRIVIRNVIFNTPKLFCIFLFWFIKLNFGRFDFRRNTLKINYLNVTCNNTVQESK